MNNKKDITGQRFGLLVAVTPKHTLGSQVFWELNCDCGISVLRSVKELMASLKNSRQSSCGCQYGKHRITHGMSRKEGGSREYHSWRSMKLRCLNPKDSHYEYYGERGITICARWIDSFENFLADMGARPTSQHTLDRINNNGNYEPSNCRWATKTIQSINRRKSKNNASGITGVFYYVRLQKWRAVLQIYGKQIGLGDFSKVEDAITARKEAEKKYFTE